MFQIITLSSWKDTNIVIETQTDKRWNDSGTIGRSCFSYPDIFNERTMADTVGNTNFVRRSKEEKKILRKQLKASHILLKHEGITAVSQPTKVMISWQLTRR